MRVSSMPQQRDDRTALEQAVEGLDPAAPDRDGVRWRTRLSSLVPNHSMLSTAEWELRHRIIWWGLVVAGVVDAVVGLASPRTSSWAVAIEMLPVAMLGLAGRIGASRWLREASTSLGVLSACGILVHFT